MIILDVCDVRQSTYKALVNKLTDTQVEQLRKVQNVIKEAVAEASCSGRWRADRILIEDFDLARVVIAELRMKGFKVNHVDAHKVTRFRNDMYKKYYCELEISWGLGE